MLPVIRDFLAMHWLHWSLCHLKLLDWFWIFGEWVWRYKFQIWEWTFARNETNTILRDKMVGAQFQIHWFVKDCRKEDSRTTLPHKSRAKRVQWSKKSSMNYRWTLEINGGIDSIECIEGQTEPFIDMLRLVFDLYFPINLNF